MHQRGQVRKVHAYWGQILSGTELLHEAAALFCACRETGHHWMMIFRSPARASRALAETAASVTSPVCRPASLFEGLAPARVTERVRLPLVNRPGVDKPVHGQRTSITVLSLALITCTALTHTPAVNGVAFLIGSSIVQFCYLRRLFFKIDVSYQFFLPFR